METKDIILTRGDSLVLEFTLVDENNEEYRVSENDKLYFTVKEDYTLTEVVLQKTYGNGIRWNNSTDVYEIELEAEDTNELPFCRLVYDIELIIGVPLDEEGLEIKRYTKTLIKGVLELTEEVTHKENEI